jgi:tetratricopeptide (TPR) repeat protein
MVKYFRSYMAAFLYGKGLMKFHKREYKEAAKIFYKVYNLDPNQERMELTCLYLGRSLLEIGEHYKAVEYLSKSYDIFNVRILDSKYEYEREEFSDCVRSYLKALNEAGQTEMVRQVEQAVRTKDIRY